MSIKYRTTTRRTSCRRLEHKIKLNHTCQICKKELYISEGTIIEGRPLHFKCYRDEAHN
ncbi:MAG: hypothetical protein AABY22_14310 [Nanoarchaeota archaeon]